MYCRITKSQRLVLCPENADDVKTIESVGLKKAKDKITLVRQELNSNQESLHYLDDIYRKRTLFERIFHLPKKYNGSFRFRLIEKERK